MKLQDILKAINDRTSDSKSKEMWSPSTGNAYTKLVKSLLADWPATKDIDPWFEDSKKAIKLLTDGYAPSTSKTRLASICGLISKGFIKVTDRKPYDDAFEKLQKSLLASRKQNEDPTAFPDSYTWNNFLSDVKKYTTSHPNTPYSVLLAMYTLIPPRRLEYRTLTIFRKVGLRKVPPTGNVVYLSATKPARLYLRDFKTAKSYGSYEVDLPMNLSKILLAYCEGYPTGTLLFENTLFNEYDEPSFSSFVIDAVKAATGHAAGARDLRKLFLSSVDFNNTSVAERERLANAMGHSTSEQALYVTKGAIPESDVPALRKRVAELEAENMELRKRLARYENGASTSR